MSAFHQVRSPVDLMSAVGVAPLSAASAAFLDAATAAPADAATRRLFRSMSRQKWPTRAPRIVVRCSGRGSGKTTDAAWLGAFHLLCVDHDAHAMPGSRVYNLVIGPRRQTAAESARIQRAVLDQLAPLGVTYEVLGERSDAIELVVTSPRTACERVVRVVSFDSAAPRGYAIAFAHFPELGHAWTASTHVRRGCFAIRRCARAAGSRVSRLAGDREARIATSGSARRWVTSSATRQCQSVGCAMAKQGEPSTRRTRSTTRCSAGRTCATTSTGGQPR